MTITEALMRPGSGTVRLRSDTPLWITNAIRRQILTGAGGHIVITPYRIDPPDSVTDAHLHQVALYSGRVIGSPSRCEFDVTGMSTWLDGLTKTVIAQTNGTPTQWVDAVLLNGLTRGVVSGGANVTKSFPAYAQTRRQILDHVAQAGGWEYEVRPSGAINAGTSVFVTTPRVIVTGRNEGRDGDLTGLAGGLVDQAIDARAQASEVIAIGRGNGSGIVVASAPVTTALRTRAGLTPELVQVVNAPSADAAQAAVIATTVGATTAFPVVNVTADTGYQPQFVDSFTGEILLPAVAMYDNGLTGPALLGSNTWDATTLNALTRARAFAGDVAAGARPSASIDGGELVDEQPSRLHLRAGDFVYLWDPESGLIDTSVQAFYRGETVFPMIKRVLEHTWKIRRGFGVVWRGNAVTPSTSALTLIDLTQWVEWEDGGDELVIGDKSSATFAPGRGAGGVGAAGGAVTGLVNRENPDVEARVASDVAWTTATPMENGWIAFDAGRPLQYRKLGDIVYLQGVIKDGTINTTAFTLPVGFRPTASRGFVIYNAAGPALVAVNATGAITVVTGTNVFAHLDGICFSTT